MPFDPTRAKALFLAALDRPDRADRIAFLDRECGDDPELRRRLEELIAAYERPATALNTPMMPATIAFDIDPDWTRRSDPTAPVIDQARTRTAAAGPAGTSEPPASFRLEFTPPGPTIGSVIADRYKLREEIGEGGMGSVYLAEQLQPVRRQVALKLIKPGMDSRTVLARFDSERQALALMDHPHIAKVLDAGATDQGRPFFVMELVKGVPLTTYCDEHHLSLPDRLAVFRQICSAVQHAHQKGIIHRDLKPSNILVESHDGKPVPKVIDFGLAKAIGGLKLTEQSLYTAFGGVAGTPLYMAPEQASFNAMDIDTRADIYALGVILYELLTGSTPIRRETFHRAALDEMLRLIREFEPPTPSSRISSSDALPSLAANRLIEPARFTRFVRGDLDWIVMKALAKERHRRYDSAIGLANDLERFEHHEPVSAGPPSSLYRLRKFARRNRPQVVAASLVVLALVGGMVGTTLGLFEARRQRQIAQDEATLKDQARIEEARQRRQAEGRLVKLEAANRILGSIFKDLDPSSAENGGTPLLAQLGERLDQATAQIEGESIGDPMAVARMQMILGSSQVGLGNSEKAIVLITKALATIKAQLGPDHPDTLAAMNGLASSYQTSGKLDRAIPLYEETLGLRKARLGPGHLDTLETMTGLAIAFNAAGKLDPAITLYEQALPLRKAELGHDHPDTLFTMNHLAVAYLAAGKTDRAIPLQEETLARRKATIGPDHLLTLTSMSDLAAAYVAAGQHDRAIPLYEQTLSRRKAALAPDHPNTLATMTSLAGAYKAVGRVDRAMPLLEESATLMKAKLGHDHPHTLIAMNNLARGYQDTGQLDRAIVLYEETRALMKAKLGPDHPYTLGLSTNLARTLQDARQLDRAISIYEETLAVMKTKLGVDHPSTLITTNHLAGGYQAVGQLDRANPLLEATIATMKTKLGVDHPQTLAAMTNLATGYQAAGQLDRALPLLRELVDRQRSKAGPNSSPYAGALSAIGLVLLSEKKATEAEPPLREALAIRETKEPNAWSTSNTKSILGGALLAQKKYDEADPLLRAGYEGMKRQADKIPPIARQRPIDALDRLIELAEATGKPNDARAWRDEKARITAPPTEEKTP